MIDVAGFLKRLGTVCPGLGFGRRFAKNSSGNTAIIFAISAIPMTFAVGGAVDYARYYDAEQTMQTAIDAAVLAGASAGNSSTVAAQTFSSWAIKIDGTVGTPTFCVGKATTACDSAATQYYAGKASGSLNMYFTRLAGIKTVNVNVTATAQKTVGSTATSSGSCIILKSTSASPGLNVNNGTINASTCEIDVFSKSSSAVTIDRSITVKKLCIAGTANPNSKPANFYTSCTPPADPYAGNLPTVSDSSYCSSAGSDVNYNNNGGAVTVGDSSGPFTSNNIHCGRLNFSGGALTLYPGVYGGGINFNNSPTVTFQPGLYVIKNVNWNLNGGTYTGTDVTFYIATQNAMIQFNNTATANFAAPTSGTYSGVLMYEPTGLSTSAWTMNMTGTWSGLVYLPSRDFTFNSSGTFTQTGTLVFDTMISSVTLNISSASGTGSGSGSASVVRLIH